MIRRIFVDGYKSLRAVELADLGHLVLLFGVNASGKSNFLDALDLLSHLVREDTVQQAFQRHRGSRAHRALPVRQFFTHDARASNTMVFEVDVELQESLVARLNKELEDREKRENVRASYTRVSERRLRYRVALRYDPEARALEVTEESLVPLGADGEPKKSVKPFIRAQDGVLSVKLERQSHPRAFPLPRTRTLLSEIGDLVNHPHAIATARELGSISVYYIEPTRMRSEINDVDARNPGSNGQTLPAFYHWLQRTSANRFLNLQHNLRRLVPGFDKVEVRTSTDGFLELWVTEAQRGAFPAALLSEGTLRLLCLLGILASPEPPSVVGYEEPENGIHPGRLDEILEIIMGRAGEGVTQVFMTTHSPEVLDKLEDTTRVRVTRGEDGESAYEPVQPSAALLQPLERSVLGSMSPPPTLGQRLVRGELG